MHTTYPTLFSQGIRIILLILCLLMTIPAARAQVAIQMRAETITIHHAQHLAQWQHDAASRTWHVVDQAGMTYAVGGYQDGDDSAGDGTQDDEDPVVVGGYQDGDDSAGDGTQDDEDPVVVGGYQEALDYLRTAYGAIIKHDEKLGVDLVFLPDYKDPLGTFFRALHHDTVLGRPLIDFFRLIDVANRGVFGEPDVEAAIPAGTPLSFPTDRYYQNQWNLVETGLARAVWLPTAPNKRARIAIIDSGVGEGQRRHEGLDGTPMHHQAVAPTTGFPVPHALGLVSLLADRNNDGDGITSLLGTWEASGCYDRAALTAAQTPVIYSYNVGDFGPVNIYVARAIRQAVAQGVDVINLSLRMAYSPVVEEAIQAALDAGVIVVAAAGNYAADAPDKPTAFPANLDGVLAVGAAGPDRGFSPLSARAGVDVLAPGEQIVVGAPQGVWHEVDGTSYAAPHVTAALALMRTVRPDLTPADAREALRRSAYDPDGDGIGFLDATAALNEVLPATERVDWTTVPLPHECGASLLAADEEQPAALVLDGNYPNPFNPETAIRFTLPDAQHVRLSVFNAVGRRVQVLADGAFEAGRHEVRFHAEGLPSGTYFYRLEAGSGVQVHSMVLMK